MRWGWRRQWRKKCLWGGSGIVRKAERLGRRRGDPVDGQCAVVREPLRDEAEAQMARERTQTIFTEV